MYLHWDKDYDITPAIEQYRGKSIEELFPNHTIIKNEMGECLQILWEIKEFPANLGLKSSRNNVLSNLKTVCYIGDKIEKSLFRKGISSILDLRMHLRYYRAANDLISHIKKKDYISLLKNPYITDLDLSFCFKLSDFLFIDIETSGLYDGPINTVGLGYFEQEGFKIQQFFARSIEEEIAILEHLKSELLDKFKCLVSYNGKTFDIPYLANRFLYYFDMNPMITKEDTPYKKANTKFHHIDLYHNIRRRFKGQFQNYTLSNIETQLLNWQRTNDLPGYMVIYSYNKYLEDPKRNVGLVKECIEHNYYDIYSLPLLYKKLLSLK